MTEALAKKLLLVGWDAADWQLMHPLIDSGRMPHLLISQKDRRQKMNFHDAAESDPYEARWTKPCAQHS